MRSPHATINNPLALLTVMQSNLTASTLVMTAVLGAAPLVLWWFTRGPGNNHVVAQVLSTLAQLSRRSEQKKMLLRNSSKRCVYC